MKYTIMINLIFLIVCNVFAQSKNVKEEVRTKSPKSDSFITNDNSHPIISTGPNATFNEYIQYASRDKEYNHNINRISELDSTISRKDTLVKKYQHKKESEELVAALIVDIKKCSFEKDSLIKENEKIEENYKELFKSSKKYEIREKEDSLYKVLMKRYPYGFKIFYYGKNIMLPVKNKFEPDMFVYVDWDNLSTIINDEKDSFSIYFHKLIYKVKATEINTSDITLGSKSPNLGEAFNLRFIHGLGVNLYFEYNSSDSFKNKIYVIGFGK